MSAPDPVVGDLTEGEILARILGRFPPSRALLGPGDDAAVLAAPGGRIVASVDTLVHGPDFRLAWSSAWDLGWKAAAVNLADIAAMGARPTALLVALAMPDHTPVSFVEGLAEGLRAGCDELAPGAAVEGGDLTVSDTLTIAMTALGVLDGAEPVTRSGARPGDVVAVCGELGKAAQGLAILFGRFCVDGRPVPIAPLPGDDAALVDAQLRPRPPIAAGARAATHGATAMMDVSDGLALDAGRLARASDVTLELRTTALGPHPADALAGGEDHALLATFPAAVGPAPGFRVIGSVGVAGEDPVLVDGEPYDGKGGWDPYRDWDTGSG
ncbi:thiamine-phosphate kinase [Microbacterium sp. ET2]|uniref:thiamine-phosphate kinase n=1 Tax=Microbacterium albipurpureum TaxID=3050384 RepID=UPI00259CAE36|nr:thiamine-phosphate kinase [Microbacterium sp. ET2 (Ac-2212)]WJL95792.1 thiamine-phosphate kinase [Microbacterium sp. ET2 (Ac-2212)]